VKSHDPQRKKRSRDSLNTPSHPLPKGEEDEEEDGEKEEENKEQTRERGEFSFLKLPKVRLGNRKHLVQRRRLKLQSKLFPDNIINR
jgi:hypothetical protein